jgi:hypothetical protein
VEVIWLFVGGALWLVGGNVVVALSCRRRGLPWWYGFRPFGYRYLSRMNWLEWLAIVSLGVLSMAIMAIGASPRQ